MKNIYKIFFLSILLTVLPISLFAQVTVSFTGVPGGTLNHYQTFTATVQVSPGNNLRGVSLAFRTEPEGALTIKSVVAHSPAPASNIYQVSSSTRRLLWFNSAGSTENPLILADVTFEVPAVTLAASTKLIINVLQIIAVGSTNPVAHIVNLPTVNVQYTAPTPIPTATVPTPTPTPTHAQYTENAKAPALYTVFGGCGEITDNGKSHYQLFVLMFLLVLMFILFFVRKNPKSTLPIIFILIVTISSLKSVSAETYYVDKNDSSCTDGDRTGAVNYDADPFCTIQAIFAKKLLPGDIIEIRDGGSAYQEGTLIIDYPTNGSGVLGIPITLRGAASSVPINGGTHAAIGIQRTTSYWVIENLTFQNGGPWGSSLVPNGPSAAIGGEQTGPGIIIRNVSFTGAIADPATGKDVIRLNSEGVPFNSIYDGHLIEGNTFNNLNFSSEGVAYISISNSSNTIIKGNKVTHTDANSGTPANRFINLSGGSGNIIERNFLAANFRGSPSSSGIIIFNQDSPAIIRNNIIYMKARALESAYTSLTDDQPMSGIRLSDGTSSIQNRIHNNSINIDMLATTGLRKVNGIYSGNDLSGSDVINNIFAGGDYAANGQYLPDYSTGGGVHFRLDYNDTFSNTPHTPLYDTTDITYPKKYRCYMGWWYDYTNPTPTNCETFSGSTHNVTDSANPYVGGDSYIDTSYALNPSSSAYLNTWSTESRCTDIKGNVIACDGDAGSSGGANPYGMTTTFSFCGDVWGPSGQPDRIYDLRDIITLWGSDHDLATAVATYLVTLNSSNLTNLHADCFE